MYNVSATELKKGTTHEPCHEFDCNCREKSEGERDGCRVAHVCEFELGRPHPPRRFGTEANPLQMGY